MQGIFQNMTHLSKTINAIYRTTILYWKNFYNCKEFNALIKQFLLISVKTKDTVKTEKDLLKNQWKNETIIELLRLKKKGT